MEDAEIGVRFAVEPLGKNHNRAAFSCGEEALDRYIKTQASQDIRNNVAAVFVLLDNTQDKIVVGYFTLSAWAVLPSELPVEVLKRLPKYERLPATLLGRLAISKDYGSQGLGGMLLMKALQKSLVHSREIGSTFVVVHAKNERAREFYEKRGFLRLVDQPNSLFLPMATIEELHLTK